MENIKAKKINEVFNKYGSTLNLHEIKSITGAGNGYKHHDHDHDIEFGEELGEFDKNHKSHKIKEVINQHDGNLNLHEIKAKTGAGSGHKH